MRRIICAMFAILIAGALCGARQLSQRKAAPVQHQPGVLAVDRTPVSAATLEALITQVAQQILKQHLKSVAVIGAAGPMPDLPTQFGLEFGDKFSAALAKQSNDFRVEDRAELREIVKKNLVSDVMVVSDGLANWVASKAGVEGYVVVEFTRVASGGAEVLVTLYRTDKEDGYFLSSANTDVDLTWEQYMDGLRPIDSDWNKLDHESKDKEKNSLPPGGMPTCIACPRPEMTDLSRKQGPHPVEPDCPRSDGCGMNELVVTYVTVFPDGKAGDIAIIRSARFGLTARAIEVIPKWQFKPGLDANGNATKRRIRIETMFQTY